MIEEGAFEVTITFKSVVLFSPIERPRPLTLGDAIENAKGMISEKWFQEAFDEGLTVEYSAERIQ